MSHVSTLLISQPRKLFLNLRIIRAENCPICLDIIKDHAGKKKGHNAIFCAVNVRIGSTVNVLASPGVCFFNSLSTRRSPFLLFNVYYSKAVHS